MVVTLKARQGVVIIMNSSEYVYAFKAMLYALSPEETYFESLKETPTIFPRVLVLLTGLSLLEGSIIHLRGDGKNWSSYIAMINILTGCLTVTWNYFFLRGVELFVYLWCYNNICLLHLPWNSLYTYIICMLGVDFCTYWWHRQSHEVAVFWAAHASHHTGEEYNVTTSVRISLFVRFTKWAHFVPLAILGVPPSIFVIHSQMNFVFGVFSHSWIIPKMHKIIPGLGHLTEFIMVTPSHHRVHHGVDKYCLDKNYGMYLIIWDRMFGTFAEERDEPITYGTVSQADTFNVVNVQLQPYQRLYEKVQMMKTTDDKLRTLFYGPGWSPGKPRLGDENDIPDVRARKKQELFLPSWLTMYLAFQTVSLVLMLLDMGVRVQIFGQWMSFVNFFMVLSACTSLGAIFDSKYYAVWLEPFRLVFLLIVCHLYPMFSNHMITTIVSAYCLGSLLFWPMLNDYLDSRYANTTSVKNGVKKHKTM